MRIVCSTYGHEGHRVLPYVRWFLPFVGEYRVGQENPDDV